MSKIVRATQKIFGSLAGANQIGKFGSLAAGTPSYASNPADVQSFANYLTGWYGAVMGLNSPAIEDMNAVCYLYAYQLAYILQAGVAEYDAGTTYYINSMVNSGGYVYVSITDGNLNNAVTNPTYWRKYSTAALDDGIVGLSKVDAAVNDKLLPPGMISPYGGRTAPSGWLICDGLAISRSAYSGLYAAIDTQFGAGDGSTTFNLPDFRGRFLRGWDHGAGRDPDVATRTPMFTGGNFGDGIGTLQGQATKRPNTAFTTDNPGDHSHSNNAAAVQANTGQSGSGITFNGAISATISPAGAHSHTVTGGGDAETRPINAFVNYIIKV